VTPTKPTQAKRFGRAPQLAAMQRRFHEKQNNPEMASSPVVKEMQRAICAKGEPSGG